MNARLLMLLGWTLLSGLLIAGLMVAGGTLAGVAACALWIAGGACMMHSYPPGDGP